MNFLPWMVFGASVFVALPASADDAKITWYDVSCRYMLVEVPEGFGLYE